MKSLVGEGRQPYSPQPRALEATRLPIRRHRPERVRWLRHGSDLQAWR